MGFIIFTDLDGTLLDHRTYGWSEAEPALHRIRREDWPLIPVTSKTRAEVVALYDALQLSGPIVVENGGGIFLPDVPPWSALGDLADGGHFVGRDLHRPGPAAAPSALPRRVVLGEPWATLRQFVAEHGDELGMRGFGDLTCAEVMELTGLDRVAAARAQQREFTEPFVLDGSVSVKQVRRAIMGAGFAMTTGGRFHHLIGARQSKGRAVELLTQAWRDEGHPGQGHSGRGHPHDLSVSLGDGENDVPMLEVTDFAIAVPAPERPLPQVERTDLIVAPAEGPAGWSAALLSLFDSEAAAPSSRSIGSSPAFGRHDHG